MITKLRGQGFTSTMCSCHHRKQDDKSWLICASMPMCNEMKEIELKLVCESISVNIADEIYYTRCQDTSFFKKVLLG